MEKGTGETEIPASEGKIVRLKGGTDPEAPKGAYPQKEVM